MTFENYVIENNLGTIESGYSFKELTTIGCGGRIKTLYTPNSIESLCTAFKYVNDISIKYFILGNGSNILASDSDFMGVVFNLRKMPSDYVIIDDILDCSAFYSTSKLAYELANEEKGDLSFLCGIPGLIGGAIYNNCGAYNDNIQNHLIDVTYINSNGNILTIKNEDCDFDYRRSIFHYFGCIIISARFKISKFDSKKIIARRMNERRLAQPLECKNMGSIFKNNKLVKAWEVIDALGMRGYHINDAAISSKHANFIINSGNAKSSDIISLINLIQKRSMLELGIKLVCEITII